MKLYNRWFGLAVERAASPVARFFAVSMFKTGRAPWCCGNIGPFAFAVVLWANEPRVRP